MSSPSFSAIIVDDEPLAVEGIRRLFATSTLVDVVGEAADGPAALKLIAALLPQAVFLDISMPGMSGLEVADTVRSLEAPPLVVLVTANDNFATQAFDLAVVDYVLKPIDPARMMRAVERVSTILSQQGSPAAKDGALWVPYRGSVVRVSITEISRIEAERDYVRVYDAERSYLLRATMADLSDRLGERFIRIHRSTVIARERVTGLRHAGNGSWTVIDPAGDEFAIGRTYLSDVRSSLDWS